MTISEEQSIDGARHAGYELKMLSFASFALLRPGVHEIQNILNLEGFLMHARNLLEFFVLRKAQPKGNAIWAGLYVKDWWPEGTLRAEAREVRRIMDSIDKHLAHLTVERVGKQPEWDLMRIGTLIIDMSKEFIRTMPLGQQAWFHDFIAALLLHRVEQAPDA